MLDEVRQKCFVNVAEEGTKAAAVTAIACAQGCAQDPQPAPKVITFNRPFLWVIGDLTTPAAPGSWGCARNRDTPARRKKITNLEKKACMPVRYQVYFRRTLLRQPAISAWVGSRAVKGGRL